MLWHCWLWAQHHVLGAAWQAVLAGRAIRKPLALMGALLPCAWLRQGGGQWLLSISPYPSLGPQGWPGGKSSAAVDSRHNCLSTVPLQHSPNNARSPCQVPSPQPRSADDGVVLGEPSAGQRALDCEQHNDALLSSAAPHSVCPALGNVTGPPVGKHSLVCPAGL